MGCLARLLHHSRRRLRPRVLVRAHRPRMVLLDSVRQQLQRAEIRKISQAKPADRAQDILAMLRT